MMQTPEKPFGALSRDAAMVRIQTDLAAAMVKLNVYDGIHPGFVAEVALNVTLDELVTVFGPEAVVAHLEQCLSLIRKATAKIDDPHGLAFIPSQGSA